MSLPQNSSEIGTFETVCPDLTARMFTSHETEEKSMNTDPKQLENFRTLYINVNE